MPVLCFSGAICPSCTRIVTKRQWLQTNRSSISHLSLQGSMISPQVSDGNAEWPSGCLINGCVRCIASVLRNSRLFGLMQGVYGCKLRSWCIAWHSIEQQTKAEHSRYLSIINVWLHWPFVCTWCPTTVLLFFRVEFHTPWSLMWGKYTVGSVDAALVQGEMWTGGCTEKQKKRKGKRRYKF